MYTGPNIVRNGLVLCLDAASLRSYPGSGTTWNDLSGNNNNGTLTNGPTFNSENGGSIVFDGTNDYAPITGSVISITNPNLSQENKTNPLSVLNWYQILNNFTFEFTCRPTSTLTIRTESQGGTSGTSGQRYIMAEAKSTNGANNGCPILSVGTNGIQVFEHGDGYLPCLLSYSTTISTPIDICVVYTSKTPNLYVNGVLVRTGLTSAKTNVDLSALNPGICSSFYTPFAGNIYNIKYYNRVLSQDEITQNFNATKTRFGL